MEETFGTAVPRVFLDLELTYEFNPWFKKMWFHFSLPPKSPELRRWLPTSTSQKKITEKLQKVQQLYFNSKNQHKHARILDGQTIVYHVSWLKAGYITGEWFALLT